MVNGQALISVVVTTFNRVTYLAETLASIEAQTYRDFEIIVVDNYSTDGTDKLLQDYKGRNIHFISHQNNGIIAVNRNIGVSKANGEYIAFCDDDDLWFPTKLEKQMKALSRWPKAVLCYTNAESFNEKGTLKAKRNSRSVMRNHFIHLLSGNFIQNSSVLVRTNVLRATGCLSEDPDIREDYDLWLRIAARYEIIGIDEALIKYRVHNSNIASNRARETLKALYTLRKTCQIINYPVRKYWTGLFIQYGKYLVYQMSYYLGVSAFVG